MFISYMSQTAIYMNCILLCNIDHGTQLEQGATQLLSKTGISLYCMLWHCWSVIVAIVHASSHKQFFMILAKLSELLIFCYIPQLEACMDEQLLYTEYSKLCIQSCTGNFNIFHHLQTQHYHASWYTRHVSQCQLCKLDTIK